MNKDQLTKIINSREWTAEFSYDGKQYKSGSWTIYLCKYTGICYCSIYHVDYLEGYIADFSLRSGEDIDLLKAIEKMTTHIENKKNTERQAKINDILKKEGII